MTKVKAKTLCNAHKLNSDGLICACRRVPNHKDEHRCRHLTCPKTARAKRTPCKLTWIADEKASARNKKAILKAYPEMRKLIGDK